MRRIGLVGALLLLGACSSGRSPSLPTFVGSSDGVQARSLAGEALYPPAMEPEDEAKRRGELEEAIDRLEAHPNDPNAWIWVGRRLGYLGLYREAVSALSSGLGVFADEPRLLRHRGHRWITLRQFELAKRDLSRAAKLVESMPDEPEPSGSPNARGVVIDTLKQNVYYHLGLAHYLQGDFRAADSAFSECLRFSTNPDALCSATHWLYMTLRRRGSDARAAKLLDAIHKDLDVIEYHAYFRLCLMYKGELLPDRVLAEVASKGLDSTDYPTTAYGVGNWYLYNGDAARAREVFEQAARAPMWAAFGRIASEAELAR